MAPGQRAPDASDFPPEKAAYAMRDVAFLARKAREHGEAVGPLAQELLAGALPRARIRPAYALPRAARRDAPRRGEGARPRAPHPPLIDISLPRQPPGG